MIVNSYTLNTKITFFYYLTTFYPPKQNRFEESLGHLRIFPWKFLTKEWILIFFYLIFKFSLPLLVNMSKLRDNVSKNLPSWNLGGRQIVSGPIYSDSSYNNRPVANFPALENQFWPKFSIFSTRGGQNRSKLTLKTFYSQNCKFHPICMKFISEVEKNVSIGF